MLARIGVILLLFEVGPESSVREMVKVGWSSLLVAILGVIAPMGLGWMTGRWLLPEESWHVPLFLGTTLCATSVGITASNVTIGRRECLTSSGLHLRRRAARAGQDIGMHRLERELNMAKQFAELHGFDEMVVKPRLFRKCAISRSAHWYHTSGLAVGWQIDPDCVHVVRTSGNRTGADPAGGLRTILGGGAKESHEMKEGGCENTRCA